MCDKECFGTMTNYDPYDICMRCEDSQRCYAFTVKLLKKSNCYKEAERYEKGEHCDEYDCIIYEECQKQAKVILL